MIDLQNPWLLLGSILLGSPLFLALINRWVSKGDRQSMREDSLRHDLLQRISDLETRQDTLTKNFDDCRAKLFIMLEKESQLHGKILYLESQLSQLAKDVKDHQID